MNTHDIEEKHDDIHEECKKQCRSSILRQHMELFPDSLTKADTEGYLPLHRLLENEFSSAADALVMIEKYPAALQHQTKGGHLPLHIECENQCRSSIISKCIELYPEALAIDNGYGYLPLHILLSSTSSSIDVAMMMIEKYPAALQHRDNYGNLPLHMECMKQCRSSITSRCIELYPEALAKADDCGFLPLHWLLHSESSTVEDALLMIEKYPAALQHQTKAGHLPLHIECRHRCRSSIISKCFERYPEGLSIANEETLRLPLHLLLRNDLSTIDDALTMIEEYREALQHRDKHGDLPLHIECFSRCRSSVISKCIELYPEGLSIANEETLRLPLHLLLRNDLSTIDDALTMIEKYPAALQHQSSNGLLPLHIECKHQCRSSIISKCIELYPVALTKRDDQKFFPLHKLLINKSSSVENALVMIRRCPAALKRSCDNNYSPLHLECAFQCRSIIIYTCIEVYPEALSKADMQGYLPLHRLVQNKSSPIDAVLLMIERYPAALQHSSTYGSLPLHIECDTACRPSILMKCIQLYPETLDYRVIIAISEKINQSNFRTYASVLPIIFTLNPMSLFEVDTYSDIDCRKDLNLRRRILNLLPRHVFTPIHELDYRDLNWQPRAAMMMLLSQLKMKMNAQQNNKQSTAIKIAAKNDSSSNASQAQPSVEDDATNK
jgi:ankyrin repeat protein